MKASEVYRKAAKMMEDHHECTRGSCCWAIQLAKDPMLIFGNSRADPECIAMKNIFAPKSTEAYWMGEQSEHDFRILALCFMAAIAEDEERSRKRRN